MYLNGYSVRVPEGNEVNGYVELEHGEHYTLRLANRKNLRCDARVEIDNKHVGTWRINAHDSIRLERPAHDKGRFTFYLADSEEAGEIGLDEADPNLGLIKVTFMPEKQTEWVANTSNVAYAATATYAATTPRGSSAGGTGLSGKSSQEFGNTHQLNYDHFGTTVIHLRLVGRDDDGPRPLTSFSTPIPPPVR